MRILKLNPFIRNIIASLGLIFFTSCAQIPVQAIFPSFNRHEVSLIISGLQEQEKLVHTFLSKGRISFKNGDSTFEANILIIGTRDPLKIKLEITHRWGRPILEFLIQETELNILSFAEKKFYSGHIGTPEATRFLPVRLDPDEIWAFMRGYPVLRKYERIKSLKESQLMFFNEADEMVQSIDFFLQSNLPHIVFLPGQEIKKSFSDYKNENGIYYARQITLNDKKEDTFLSLSHKQIVFNKTLPKDVYKLKIPHDFKVVSLP